MSEKKEEYIETVYAMAKFWIQDDYYTIEEIEDMLVQFRKIKREQDAALKRSMEIMEKPNDRP